MPECREIVLSFSVVPAYSSIAWEKGDLQTERKGIPTLDFALLLFAEIIRSRPVLSRITLVSRAVGCETLNPAVAFCGVGDLLIRARMGVTLLEQPLNVLQP